MLEMIQDLHGAVSLPKLEGVVGNQASGISFQQWGATGRQWRDDTQWRAAQNHKGCEPVGDDHIHIEVTSGQPKPRVGQRVIIPTHQIEETLSMPIGGNSDLELYLEHDLPVPIKGTGSTVGDIICYITDRCSYDVVAG